MCVLQVWLFVSDFIIGAEVNVGTHEGLYIGFKTLSFMTCVHALTPRPHFMLHLKAAQNLKVFCLNSLSYLHLPTYIAVYQKKLQMPQQHFFLSQDLTGNEAHLAKCI